jgi:nucleosome binding factor SPN SPT16 subunit
MGLEFRDANYVISPKNGRQMKANMIFTLSLGFQDLDDGNKTK